MKDIISNVTEENPKPKRLIHHHKKYKEIHGIDVVILMPIGEHFNLHRRLRKEGKCNIPVKELAEISRKANIRRIMQSKENYIKLMDKINHEKQLEIIKESEYIGEQRLQLINKYLENLPGINNTAIQHNTPGWISSNYNTLYKSLNILIKKQRITNQNYTLTEKDILEKIEFGNKHFIH